MYLYCFFNLLLLFIKLNNLLIYLFIFLFIYLIGRRKFPSFDGRDGEID